MSIVQLPKNKTARDKCLELFTKEAILIMCHFGSTVFRFTGQILIGRVVTKENIHIIVVFAASLSKTFNHKELENRILTSGKRIFVICILASLSMDRLRL
jgi:hypothetical protein